MSRRVVVVVSRRRDAAGVPDEMVVVADRYLEGGEQFADARTVVVNLCRSYRYRSRGFAASCSVTPRSTSPSRKTTGRWSARSA